LAVSPDHAFFVSCSDDMSIKVWDTARLERSVTSKPRHTYSQHHARVKSVCMLEGVHCFASAAEDGSLHVIRVHVNQSGSLPKYTKLQTIREYRVDSPGEYITCMVHYNSGKTSSDSSLLGEAMFYQISPQILSLQQRTLSSPSWTCEPCESYNTCKIRVILDLSLLCVWTASAHGFSWALLWVYSHSGTDVLACLSKAGKSERFLREKLRE
jgi:WD40 repeat protein